MTMQPHVIAASDQIQAWARVDWPEPHVATVVETLNVAGHQPSQETAPSDWRNVIAIQDRINTMLARPGGWPTCPLTGAPAPNPTTATAAAVGAADLDANCWLSGGEDGGVGIHCRICDTGGQPIAYLGWDNAYANVPEVRHVGTSITALIEAGVRHLTADHGLA